MRGNQLGDLYGAVELSPDYVSYALSLTHTHVFFVPFKGVPLQPDAGNPVESICTNPLYKTLLVHSVIIYE
jgi:hypothetical protein